MHLVFDHRAAGADPNAGAKLGIKLTDSVQFLISPQGDIAFSDEAVLGTDNSWVWPLGLGFRIQP